MPRWTQLQLQEVVATSVSFSDVLRHFDLRTAGGNYALARRWTERWDISTTHFTGGGDRLAGHRRVSIPLAEVLVENGRYHRGHLKKRLYDAGLKTPTCEFCGQGELWRGRRMALILDHVNGVSNDNRLENLRIVCPNCNATLPTHCGRNRPTTREPRPCLRCRTDFTPNFGAQLYCSHACGSRYLRQTGPNLRTRKVERPPYEQLMEEIATSSWSAVGRKYGVSCSSVRKWVQMEQRLRAEAREVEPTASDAASEADVDAPSDGGRERHRDAA